MIGDADCKFRAFDAQNCGEVQIGAGFGEICRNATAGWTVATGTSSVAYFFAGACGWDGGTVSISLPENTGAEVGSPVGEPPACSTVTA
ncbi:hypothetical protein SAMN05192541_12115 [Bradyrhizobium arachidis]|nr:hypothetical protein SAMN05192541_12115 [Bradyrhizobium arachidis]